MSLMKTVEKNLEKELEKNISKIIKYTFSDALSNDDKRENGNVDGDSAMGSMLQYGSIVGESVAKATIFSEDIIRAHEEGWIHIHDLNFAPMGTTTCIQIPLDKLFSTGFNTGHGHIRTPQSIQSYAALTAVLMQASQNDFHGGQSIGFLDYYLAPGVLKTFHKELIGLLEILQKKELCLEKKAMLKENIKTINLESNPSGDWFFEKFIEEVPLDSRELSYVYQQALKKTEKATFQAMESFVHNLNSMQSRAGAQVPFTSVNFGTDVSPEGRMVTKSFLLAAEEGMGRGETAIFPVSVFRMKEGINVKSSDPNYDLFKLAIRVSSKRLFPNFLNLDASYNLQFYDTDSFETQVATMGCRTRVISNINGPAVSPGRGNISFTSINLPRLAIEANHNVAFFFKLLQQQMELVEKQLLERFQWQCSKRKRNFPMALGQKELLGSDQLNETEGLYNVYKHGSLSIGFIGLAEALTSLNNAHHGEIKESQSLGLKIIKFMRDACDNATERHGLNFTLLATPAEGLAKKFVALDKEKYGIISGVTDKDYYTNSSHIPVNFDISISRKINIEAPYHELCNAGHIAYIEVDGDTAQNTEAFEQILQKMAQANMGYFAINHPVDYCPCCFFTGVINDVCPRCGRDEDNWPSFEKACELIESGTGVSDETKKFLDLNT
jgi:anaerobic ribonucleoside-triphosphate reductase